MRHPDVHLLDIQSDVDHNRSVFTLVGSPGGLVRALLAGITEAVRLIDLRRHSGAHPRLGAADVVPFVPLLDTRLETAKEAALLLAERVARELEIPVFFYEESAVREDRRNLEKIRGKGFEELLERVGVDNMWTPDVGPNRIHPSAGAMVTGARRPLIAYNIYLNTDNIKIANAIARLIRHSSGGLRYVKALGLEIPERGCVQVSMNLTYFQRTAIHTVFDIVREAAASYGVSITESEIVGLTPVEALLDASKHYLRMHNFRSEQVLELKLLELDS